MCSASSAQAGVEVFSPGLGFDGAEGWHVVSAFEPGVPTAEAGSALTQTVAVVDRRESGIGSKLRGGEAAQVCRQFSDAYAGELLAHARDGESEFVAGRERGTLYAFGELFSSPSACF